MATNSANEKQPTTSAPALVAAAPEVSLSLTEFCTRLSETVRRPELIGAFEATERKAGNIKATDAEFRARFNDFSNKPV